MTTPKSPGRRSSRLGLVLVAFALIVLVALGTACLLWLDSADKTSEGQAKADSEAQQYAADYAARAARLNKAGPASDTALKGIAGSHVGFVYPSRRSGDRLAVDIQVHAEYFAPPAPMPSELVLCFRVVLVGHSPRPTTTRLATCPSRS